MPRQIPKDEFWMTLKVVPILVSVVYLHQFHPMPFGRAVLWGAVLGLIISWGLVPLTRRLMATRYADVLDQRLGEHPTDAGCGSIMFLLFFLLAYQALFVMAPQLRAKNLARQRAKHSSTLIAPMNQEKEKAVSGNPAP